MSNEPSFLSLPDRRIAYQQRRAHASQRERPGVIFLGGFASDMTGSKASYLNAATDAAGRAFLRFDYRGHGLSSGRFTDGSIGDWLDDATEVFDKLTNGPQILVGSSMGGWIGLLLARARPARIRGFVGLAAAPDFTEDLIRPQMTDDQRAALARGESITDPSAPPDEQVPITAKLMEEAKKHLVLTGPLNLNCPVHLVQGQKDQDVPWTHALKIMDHLSAPEARLTLVKEGNHRLSRPQDLGLIWKIVDGIV